jgi:threonine dehydratase
MNRVNETLVSKDEIAAAFERIRPRIHRTPLLSCRTLSERIGVEIWLKAESLQKAGSFKARGAFNAITSLEARPPGVLTYSSGNHGQAVAYAARELNLPATIVMPLDAPAVKRAACEAYGAKVITAGTTSDDRKHRALEIQAAEGLYLIEPFDARTTIAGQGTLGLELLEQNPNLKSVIAPIGGGGLISGILAACRPELEVFGVEPVEACAMARSIAAGRPSDMQPGPTIADGLKPVRPGCLNYLHASQLGLQLAQVDDSSIRDAMRWLFQRARLVVEPSGAAALAALLSRQITPLGPCAVVLSGGNVDPRLMAEVLSTASLSQRT